MIWAFIFVLWSLKLDDRLGGVYGTSKNRVGSGAVVGVVVDQRWQKACGMLKTRNLETDPKIKIFANFGPICQIDIYYFFLPLSLYTNILILDRENLRGVSQCILWCRVKMLGLALYTMYTITGVKVKRQNHTKIM